MSRAPRALSRPELLVPLAVALALRLGLVALFPVTPAWDGVIYDRAGSELALGHGFTQHAIDPAMPSSPTAFFPVGLPAFFALLQRIGLGGGGILAVQAVVGALLVPITWVLGRRLGGRRAGRWAAWLVALWPGGVLLSISYLSEPLSTLGVALAMLPLALTHRRHLPRAAIVTALVLGLTAYLRATPLAIAPLTLFLAGIAYARGRGSLSLSSSGRSSRERRSGRVAVVTGGVFVVVGMLAATVPLAPWAMRNARALGSPVLVSTNGGFNLLMGTTGEGGYGESIARIDCPPTMTEVRTDACRRDHAVARIVHDPSAWLARGALKLANTFGYESAPAQYFAFAQPPPQSGPSWERRYTVALAACRVYWIPLLALATLGFFLASRDARRRTTVAHAVTLGPLVGFALLHFVYIGGDRYHAAVVPMMAALAGLAVVRSAQRQRSLPVP